MTGSELLDEARRLHPHAQASAADRCGASRAIRPSGERSSTPSPRDASTTTCSGPSPPPDELFHHVDLGPAARMGGARSASSPHTVHVVGESWSGRAYELREAARALRDAALVLPRRFRSTAARSSPRRARAARFRSSSSPTAPSCRTRRNAELARAAGSPVNPDRMRLRPRDRRRRTGGPVGGGLRRVRGVQHAGRRRRRHRRPGHVELADPQLPRLPARCQRPPAGPRAPTSRRGSSAPTSPSCRRATDLRRDGDELSRRPLRQRRGQRPRRAPRDRRQLPPARRPRARGAERRRRLLRRARFGGAGVVGRDVYVVGGANSAGQAALHLARYAAHGHARGARRVARRRDVALPRPPGRGDAEHRGAARDRGRGRRRRTAGSSSSCFAITRRRQRGDRRTPTRSS